MISDVLFEAREDIAKYLDDPTFADVYTPRMRIRLRILMSHMKDIQSDLDAPPKGEKEP